LTYVVIYCKIRSKKGAKLSNKVELDGMVKQAMGLVAKLKRDLMKANRECPECTGTNLNDTFTICWDCSANDFRS
jgi:hypothetical protein